MGRRLIVAGSGQQTAQLRAMAGSEVEFREGWQDEAALQALYAGARALLFPGVEDFGIMPVEAMAAGCPVIAFGRGGALETVGRGADAAALAAGAVGGIARVPGGVLFGAQSAEAIAAAVRLFEREEFSPRELRLLAEPFSGERFDAEMRAALTNAGIPPQDS